MMDHLSSDIQIVPCNTNITAEEFASVFFDCWFCENGCPLNLITDHDKFFVSRFWKTLMNLSGIKHKMSIVFHPQIDRSSECSNKTVIQALRFHVEQNQSGWVKALPKVCFNIMNTVNSSTGFSPFMLKSGHSPCLIPPLTTNINTTSDLMTDPQTQLFPNTLNSLTSEENCMPTTHVSETHEPESETPNPEGNCEPPNSSPLQTPPTSEAELKAQRVFTQLTEDLVDARDSLTTAKISQACQANKEHSPDLEFKPGDHIFLATAHRCHEYMQTKDSRVAKFMPRFD
jgi:hypothetical protein